MDCRLRCARRQLFDGYAGLSVVMVSSSFGDDIDCGGLTHFPPDGLRLHENFGYCSYPR